MALEEIPFSMTFTGASSTEANIRGSITIHFTLLVTEEQMLGWDEDDEEVVEEIFGRAEETALKILGRRLKMTDWVIRG